MAGLFGWQAPTNILSRNGKVDETKASVSPEVHGWTVVGFGEKRGAGLNLLGSRGPGEFLL